MNIRIPLVVMLAFAAGCCHKDRVVMEPVAESDNSHGALAISQIELTHSATVVHFEYYFCSRPDVWFRISSASTLTDNHGRIYQMISCEGITLDQEEYRSASGRTLFTLSFEPLGKGVKTVDFKEGDDDRDFRILGIKLKGNREKQPSKTIECVLKGEVIDRPYSYRLALLKSNEDWASTRLTYIPIRDGKFAYVLHCDEEEMYELLFVDEYIGGGWMPILFFSESGTVHFTLYPYEEGAEKNRVEGGALNIEYQESLDSFKQVLQPIYALCKSEQQALFDTDRYYSAAWNKLSTQLEQEGDFDRDKIHRELMELWDTGMALSTEAKEVREKWESAFQMEREMKLQYAQEHTSLVGYDFLQKDTWNQVHNSENRNSNIEMLVEPMKELFEKIYAPKYPHHPYTEQMHRMINSVATVREGGRYVDFTAHDLQGNRIILSEQIKGK